MKAIVFSGLLAMTLLSAAPAAEQPVQAVRPDAGKQGAPAVAPEPKNTRHSFGHTLLLYIPNRIFDVLDIVRARVRLGPGMAVGFRVTKLTDIYLGAYTSVYLGLPGPRQVPRIPWPGGIESRSGLAASVADGTVTSYDSDPRYSVTEIGAGAQLVLAGAEVGVDPAEVFDFALGLFTIDFREDDL